MTRSETVQVLSTIWVVFPRKELQKEQIELWHTIFGHYPKELVLTAIQKVLSTSAWEPKPADVRKAIDEIERPDANLSALDAYEILRGIVRRFSIYDWEKAKAVIEEAPEAVRKFISSVGWRGMHEQNSENLRAHFLKVYNDHVQKSYTNRALPEAVRGKLIEFSEKKALAA